MFNKFSSSVFSVVSDKGVLFHFLKAFRKHLGDCSILTMLATNTCFASFVQLVYSLPYVPTAHVLDVYEDVVLKSLESLKKNSHPDILANIEKWVGYLEHTWIRKPKEVSRTSVRQEKGTRKSGREESKTSGREKEEEERENIKMSGGEKEEEKQQNSKTSGGEKEEEKQQNSKTSGREEEDSRTSGLYPLHKWNQHEAALQMWPRTNNSSEGN